MNELNTSCDNIVAVKLHLLIAFFATILITGFYSASAHTAITVEQYEIDIGWRDEPPLVTQQNAIVFAITEGEGSVKSGVPNAFRDLQATVKSGGAEKTLEILSDVKVGHYYAKIIPTKTGSITIGLEGSINDVTVSEDVTIEDVESLNLLAFPPAGSAGDQDILALKNAMATLQKDITELKSGTGGSSDNSMSYDFAIFAMGIGTAGVVLAVIAMIKRK